jgi:hypothetical protein
MPSVNDTYFQHKVLSRIHGKPTFESLQNVVTELKANACSVPSTLGGGHHGHLGLLLSDARYNTLAHTVPWATPGNPGPFVPPNAGTGPQIEAARDVWRELKQDFQLCQATDKALIAQLVAAIEPIYLRALLNRDTGQYAGNIRAIILHLFNTHGKITPQQVKAKEDQLHLFHYDISQPVDIVFNNINDLVDLADHARAPMTEQQMINLAYVIFAKQTILQPDLRLWSRRPVIEHTYVNFTQHLRDAQSDLSSLPTAGDVYHQQPAQANIASIADLVVQRLLDEQGSELPQASLEQPPPPLDPFTDVANSLQRRETDLNSREANMLNQMQEMMSSMMRNNGNNNGNNNNRNRNGNRNNNGNDNDNGNRNNYRNNNGNNGNNRNNGNNGNNRNNGNNGNNGNNRAQPRQYCWSHGSCAHAGSACSSPASGHQATATFANMQNGSTNGCYWL